MTYRLERSDAKSVMQSECHTAKQLAHRKAWLDPAPRWVWRHGAFHAGWRCLRTIGKASTQRHAWSSSINLNKVTEMRNILLVSLIFLLQACMGVSMWSISNHDLKGQDLAEAIAKIKSQGLNCGPEYQEKDVLGGGPYGSVVCGAKGAAPICPTSYSAHIVFDLQSRKVLSITKDERENCF